MPAVAERPARIVFEWKRWPETDAFIDELVDLALEGNAFAAALAEPDAWRDGDAVQGLGRSPGGPRRAGAARRLEALGLRAAARRRTPSGCPFSLMPTGFFPGLRCAAARPANGADLVGVGSGDQGRAGGGFFASPRSGAGDRRLPDGPLSGRPGSRRANDCWPWSSGAAISGSSRFRAIWLAKGG